MFCPDDPFVKFLAARKGGGIYLKPYWGNSGDTLIWLGIELLLKELGIVQIVNPRKADVILWPGGNPTMWINNLEGWQDCWDQWPDKDFVVAPATFQGETYDWRGLLRNSPAKVAGLFARDPVSHQNLLKAGLRSDILFGLGHDPALNLKDSEWVSRHREASTSEYVLASFRGDHESALMTSGPDKLLKTWPLSAAHNRYQRRRQKSFNAKRLMHVKKLCGTDKTIIECDAPMMSFERFVECVRRASEVHTDRLHCMILAALLGKTVFAYTTAYGKLEAVYEHSIKSWVSIQFVHA